MTFKVVNADHRLAQRSRQRTGHACAHQQGTGKARTPGVGHHIDIAEHETGTHHHLAGERQHAADVVTAGQFRHHAAIGLVHLDLAVQGMCEQTRPARVPGLGQSHAGFVAGRFNPQNKHAPSLRGAWASPLQRGHNVQHDFQAAAAAFCPARNTMTPLRLISSMATKALLADLVALYQTQTPEVQIDVESVGGVDAAKRVEAGEAFDGVVLARNAIDKLVANGHVLAGSRTDLVHSGVAVAVPAGAPVPDISTEAALKAAILAAPTLGYSTGPSGVQLARQFETWGIAQEIAPRIVQAKPGVPVGSLVANVQHCKVINCHIMRP